MVWIMFAIGAALCWGVYGPALHKGQTLLGNPLKALFCVGVAYMLIGVLVPVLGLGGISGFNSGGSIWSGIGGALGALGAVCIIWAFKAGGLPNYVMPLVFGGAPVINTFVSILTTPGASFSGASPFFYAGLIVVAVGAVVVLVFAPKPKHVAGKHAPAVKAPEPAKA
jgi:hypothetical protein